MPSETTEGAPNGVGRRAMDGELVTVSVVEHVDKRFVQAQEDMRRETDKLRNWFIWLFGGSAAVALAVLIGIWTAWGDYRDWRGASAAGATEIVRMVQSNSAAIERLSILIEGQRLREKTERDKIRDMFHEHERNHPSGMTKGLFDGGKRDMGSASR